MNAYNGNNNSSKKFRSISPFSFEENLGNKMKIYGNLNT